MTNKRKQFYNIKNNQGEWLKMSTKKIIRQILLGAALTINATALSTMGQHQVNATNTLTQQNQAVEKKLDQLKKDLNNDITNTTKENAAFNQQLTTMKNAIQQLEQHAADQQTKQTQTEQQLQETQKELKDTKAQLQQSEAAVTRGKELLIASKPIIANQRELLRQQEAAIQQKDKEIANLRKQLAQLTQQAQNNTINSKKNKK